MKGTIKRGSYLKLTFLVANGGLGTREKLDSGKISSVEWWIGKGTSQQWWIREQINRTFSGNLKSLEFRKE